MWWGDWILLGCSLPLNDRCYCQDLLGLFLRCLSITILLVVLTLNSEGRSHMLAFRIQSRSSSPSSDPPRPPLTGLNNRGCHSTPSSARLAASSLCMSSILVFSSVATTWSTAFTAWAVLYHNFCDSRSSCSSRGRATGGVCRAFVALNRRSFLPV